MSAKGLSDGLLSLKFMQRGKAVKRDEGTNATNPSKASLVDEAAWDVGPGIRSMLGLNDEISSLPIAFPIVHEPSYLPFLRNTETQSLQPRGLWSNLSKVSEGIASSKEQPGTDDDTIQAGFDNFSKSVIPSQRIDSDTNDIPCKGAPEHPNSGDDNEQSIDMKSKRNKRKADEALMPLSKQAFRRPNVEDTNGRSAVQLTLESTNSIRSTDGGMKRRKQKPRIDNLQVS
ncbi:hypothetical protein FRC03_005230 [Tulasnella sp. 419]|nr:hypothetical protein FRC03_005230 [Tulasnella sp. 419]